MRAVSLSVFAALALSSTAAYAAEAPFYLFSSSSYNEYQSPPLVPINPASLSYSSIPGLLSHAAGTTKNQPAIGVQEWTENQFFVTQKPVGSEKFTKAVAAIAVLGVEHGEQLVPSPTFMVKDVPTVEKIKKTLSDLAVTSEYKIFDEDKGYLNLVIGPKVSDKVHAATSAAKVIDSFRARFSDLETDIFKAEITADAAFIVEVENVANLFDTISSLGGESSMKSRASDFTGLIMGGVQKIRTHYGPSVQYNTACAVVKDLIEKTVIPKFLEAYGEGATVALLFTPPESSRHSKRADVVPAAVTAAAVFRLGNIEQCAAKDSAGCTTITNSCNGRGACIQKKTDCWVCKCNVVADSAFKGNTAPARWSGNACQYKDTVAEFHLLWGTGIVLSILVFGVTMFLISMGGSMDSGPMVAMSGGSSGIKVD